MKPSASQPSKSSSPSSQEQIEQLKRNVKLLHKLSELQLRMHKAFEKKFKEKGETLSAVAVSLGTTWPELNKFYSRESCACRGRTLKAVCTYIGEPSLAEEVVKVAEQLPSDRWRGMAILSASAINAMEMLRERWIELGQAIGYEDFASAGGEHKETIARALDFHTDSLRKLEDLPFREEIIDLLTSEAFVSTVEALTCAKRNGCLEQFRAWNTTWFPTLHGYFPEAKLEDLSTLLEEPSSVLVSLNKGRATRATYEAIFTKVDRVLQAPPVTSPSESSKASSTTPPAQAISADGDLADIPTGLTPDGSGELIIEPSGPSPELVQEKPSPDKALAVAWVRVLETANKKDPRRYSYETIAEKAFAGSRRQLRRWMEGKAAFPEDFVERLNQAFPELRDNPELKSFELQTPATQASPPSSVSPDTKRPPPSDAGSPEPVSRLVADASNQKLPLNPIVRAQIASLRACVNALEATTKAGYSFPPDQAHDLVQQAARLLGMSGLSPQEIFVAIRGEESSSAALVHSLLTALQGR